MTAAQLLAGQIERTRAWTLKLLEDFRGDEWTYQPASGLQHARSVPEARAPPRGALGCTPDPTRINPTRPVEKRARNNWICRIDDARYAGFPDP